MPRKIRSDSTLPRTRNFGVRLEQPDRTPSAIASGEELAKDIQHSLSDIKTSNLEDEMKSLRGRSWSL
jgi:hypothetical protein